MVRNSDAKKLPQFKYLLVTKPFSHVYHCQLARSPVNALNTAFWTELLDLLTLLENRFPNDSRVLLFSSAAKGAIFSAGNDLNELHVPSTTHSRFQKFWLTSTTFLARLYKSPLYTIAAMRGATPAGGCVMSLCCDYRLAMSETSIGLNEVAIGLAVPRYWARLLIRTSLSRSRGEGMLASGEMIPAKEAQKIGLVDEIVQGNRQDLLDKALRRAQQWAQTRGATGRAETKSYLRKDFADKWEAEGLEESERAWTQLSRKATIAELEEVMKRLSGRTAKM